MADFKTPADAQPEIDLGEEPAMPAGPVDPTGDAGSRPVVYSDDARPAEVTYAVVEHDGGWAYRVGDTFSEPFPSRGEAVDAAARAAAEHLLPDDDELIEYQDEDGAWRQELARGGDRPFATVADLNPVPAHQNPAEFAGRRPPATEGDTIVEAIRRRPLTAVAIAAAIGFVLGLR